ncbi:30S ribosomal protein S19 [bacterium]|nr:30S ribosomal protein S19 [bacterium]MBR2858311.1 30S ribosomal protein S19 [bacterium]
MSRSTKKGAFVEESLMKKVTAMNASDKKKPIKTWSRKSTIYPEFIGNTFEVHNGKQFIKVFITEDMIGHKLGEFAPTRSFKNHTEAKH